MQIADMWFFIFLISLSVVIVPLGFRNKFLVYRPVDINLNNWIIMPIQFFSIATVEECVFRILPGIWLTQEPSISLTASEVYLVVSTFLFVAYHPINAKWFFPAGRSIFYEPFFLFAVSVLGLLSAGLWLVNRQWSELILLHFIVLTVWVNLLGGAAKFEKSSYTSSTNNN